MKIPFESTEKKKNANSLKDANTVQRRKQNAIAMQKMQKECNAMHSIANAM
jgi:hypothetical protein